MREIKFRAWNKETKQMVDLQKITPLALAIDPWTAGAGIGVYVPDHDGIEVMQYTGLKDKNGKEIFEGDIVYAEANDTTSVIKYGKHRCINSEYDDDFHFGFYTDHGDGGADETLYPDGTLYEVAGNIYENPDMLSKNTPENSKGGT